jgi:predicted ATPase
MSFPVLTRVRIRGFRSIREAEFRPERISALVGEAGTGKSNLLAAVRALLDPEGSPIGRGDASSDGDGTIRITGELGDGSSLAVEGPGLHPDPGLRGNGPPVLFLPASLRTEGVAIPSAHRSSPAMRAAELLGRVLHEVSGEHDGAHSSATAEAVRGLVEGLEACAQGGIRGVVFLIEEPELFLPPQTQRYLYRLLRRLADLGNQILYSTHSPAFLNVARLEEIVFTARGPDRGTQLVQPEPLEAEEEFRASSEFDATRSELFLARAAVLVEGLTEKLALPFVFAAMGHDPDRERISIVECGGKANVLLIARISRAVGIPFLAVHDRDAPAGTAPSLAEQQLNDMIADVAGSDGRIELAPDFEGVAGLRGHRHKPARAWKSFAHLERDEVPEPLARLVERAVALAGS